MTTEPQAACANERGIETFDTLIDRMDGPLFLFAQREARAFCSSCPIRRDCWTQNRDEPWLAAVLDARTPPTQRPTCGTPAGYKAHNKARETPCDPCRKAEAKRTRERKRRKQEAAEAAARAKQETQDARKLPGIPDDIRALHATHVRLKAAGTDIPPSVIDGERTYQSMRHQARKARAA